LVIKKSSQNSFEVKRGLNKLGVSLRASRRTTGARLKFSVYLSDKKGSFPDGVSYAQSEEQHKQWRAEYKKEQEANWRDFAVATFKRSCANCHEVDKKAIGPGLKGLMGKNQTVIYADGSEKEVVVDEDYLRQAIVDPMSVYPKGYHPMMAKLPLSEKEVDVLVRWIKEME